MPFRKPLAISSCLDKGRFLPKATMIFRLTYRRVQEKRTGRNRARRGRKSSKKILLHTISTLSSLNILPSITIEAGRSLNEYLPKSNRTILAEPLLLEVDRFPSICAKNHPALQVHSSPFKSMGPSFLVSTIVARRW